MRLVGQHRETVASVARQLGVGWHDAGGTRLRAAAGRRSRPAGRRLRPRRRRARLGARRAAAADRLRHRHRGHLAGAPTPAARGGVRSHRQGLRRLAGPARSGLAAAGHGRRARPVPGLRQRAELGVAAGAAGARRLPRRQARQTTRWTRSAAGSSRTRWAIAVAATTRSTRCAGCCAAGWRPWPRDPADEVAVAWQCAQQLRAVTTRTARRRDDAGAAGCSTRCPAARFPRSPWSGT